MRLRFENIIGKELELLESGNIADVIQLAKTKYNIFVPNKGKLYTEMCSKIKARLDKEGVSHDICRHD